MLCVYFLVFKSNSSLCLVSAIYVITKRHTTIDAGIVLSLGVILLIMYSYRQSYSSTNSKILTANEKTERDLNIEGFGLMPSVNLGVYNIDSLSNSLKSDTAFRINRTFYIDTSKIYMIYVDPLFNYNDSTITRSLYKEFYSIHRLGEAKNIEGFFIYKNFKNDSAKSPTFEPMLLWWALRSHTPYYNALMKTAYGDTTY